MHAVRYSGAAVHCHSASSTADHRPGVQERCTARVEPGGGLDANALAGVLAGSAWFLPMPADTVGFVPLKMFQGPTCSQSEPAWSRTPPAPAATIVEAARKRALVHNAISDGCYTTSYVAT